jgi:hypothetical protein
MMIIMPHTVELNVRVILQQTVAWVWAGNRSDRKYDGVQFAIGTVFNL